MLFFTWSHQKQQHVNDPYPFVVHINMIHSIHTATGTSSKHTGPTDTLMIMLPTVIDEVAHC